MPKNNLAPRRKAWDEMKTEDKQGTKRPGSEKK